MANATNVSNTLSELKYNFSLGVCPGEEHEDQTLPSDYKEYFTKKDIHLRGRTLRLNNCKLEATKNIYLEGGMIILNNACESELVVQGEILEEEEFTIDEHLEMRTLPKGKNFSVTDHSTMVTMSGVTNEDTFDELPSGYILLEIQDYPKRKFFK